VTIIIVQIFSQPISGIYTHHVLVLLLQVILVLEPQQIRVLDILLHMVIIIGAEERKYYLQLLNYKQWV